MRHGNHNRKFGRKAKTRNALLKSLVLSLIIHERIRTTEAKAKEIRPMVEKLISRAQKGDVNTRRVIMSRLMNRAPETKKLINDIAPRFKGVSGGYTRIMKLPPRVGDAARMALIEFVK